MLEIIFGFISFVSFGVCMVIWGFCTANIRYYRVIISILKDEDFEKLDKETKEGILIVLNEIEERKKSIFNLKI